jgi:hypothetical protein
VCNLLRFFFSIESSWLNPERLSRHRIKRDKQQQHDKQRKPV